MSAPLPILLRADDIRQALIRHQVVIIAGQTGSGKTTQVPQLCLALDQARGASPCLVGHTQPRRLAARAVASRIAQERGVRLGAEVGYKVRFSDETSAQTRIKLMTDGTLLAELAHDPKLRQYSTLIIDEAHERSLNVDFLLGILKPLLRCRADLKLVITSATIDLARFCTYFGGPEAAPVLEVSGRMFPIDVRYRPAGSDTDLSLDAVVEAVQELDAGPEGDILVFLPGERDIRALGIMLARSRIEAEVLPLYSRLTNQEQDRIFHAASDRRRIILATNVAETSLTVPGIRSVVDTGLAKISRYSPTSKVQRLAVEPVSQASAVQRAGRCGRVASGVAIRVYSQASFDSRPALTDPEILRTNLAGVILQMRGLGLGDIEDFDFLDAPSPDAVRDGYETLFELGALSVPSRAGVLTPVGQQLVKIPLDPRIARMLLGGAHEGVLEFSIILASALSIQDPRERPAGRQDEADQAHTLFRDQRSDFLTLLRIWQECESLLDGPIGPLAAWCREHFLSFTRIREWSDMVQQVRGVAQELGLRDQPAGTDDTTTRLHRALLTGLMTNVACREDGQSHEYRGVRGNVVHIFPGSALFRRTPKWIMAAEVVQTSRLFARTVAAIEPAWIEQVAGHMFRRQLSDHHLDAATGQPSAFERVTMSGIVVVPRRSTPTAHLDPKAARATFLREGLALGRWQLDAPFMHHNAAIRRAARDAEARLRQRNLLIDDDALAAWFDARVPPTICEAGAFERWRSQWSTPDVLFLTREDVLKAQAHRAFDESLFPSALTLVVGDQITSCPLQYALAPGKDDDGITALVPLAALPSLADRAPWLVPGLLPDVITALIKSLPKPQRARVEAAGEATSLAQACAESMDFGRGSLPDVLSDTLRVLFEVNVNSADWPLRALPPHLRLRVRVLDGDPRAEPPAPQVACERDLPALLSKLAPRIAKAAATRSRMQFERADLTGWTFGDLPPHIMVAEPGATTDTLAYPAVLDAGQSVTLTLAPTPELAQAWSRLGIRRLFAIAIADEVGYCLDALSAWRDMVKHFAALGSEADLRDQLTCIIAERIFLEQQSAVRTQQDFHERLDAQRGRLITVTRDMGDLVARILEPRFRVAHRIASGTSRMWAASVADMREHAAYLMPRGFLALVPTDKLRSYPKYVGCMRDRLLNLREDGSKAEADALSALAPYWKRLTGWVASAMASERKAAEALGEQVAPLNASKPGVRIKAPLPQTRRVGPLVNVDAGEWLMQPGRVPAALESYRWALEEFRVMLFTSESGATRLPTADIDRLWKAVPAPRTGD